MDEYGIHFESFKKEKVTVTPGLVVNQVWGKLNGNTRCLVGIDPGVNFGITVAYRDDVRVMWGKLPTTKVKGMYGYAAYDLIEELTWELYRQEVPIIAVVEGAAYNKRFGQVGLEEVRIGFFLALKHTGMNVSIVPPATVRLGAFGSGKVQAMDVWPLLNHNGADSIGMMLYAKEKL